MGDSSRVSRTDRRGLSLSVSVPLSILGLGMSVLVAFSWLDLDASQKRLEARASERIGLLGLTLSSTIEASLRRGDRNEARRAVARANTARDLKFACYIDREGNIPYATRADLVGVHWRQTPVADFADAIDGSDEVLRGRVFVTPDGTEVVGLFPVFLDARGGQLTGSSVGLFVHRHDLSLARDATVRASLARSIRAGLLFLAVSLLLWVILRRLVVVRIARLRDFADTLRSTDDAPKIAVSGNDELAALARKLEDMAQELADNTRRLQQASRMEAIGRLAGGVAHDFNNLLTVILGNIELVRLMLSQPKPSSSDLEPLLNEMRDAGTRASDLTRQLLAFGRQNTARPRVLSPADTIRQLEPLMQRMVGDQHTLVFDLPATRSIRIDPGHFEQMLLNLVINARDAMSEGGPISVRCEDAIDASDGQTLDTVRLSVEDSGQGIAQENIDRIFEPFFSTKQVGQGSGLGLPTVYSIVAEAGGRIDVESSLGEGACFRVVLPAAEASAPTHSAQAPQAPQLAPDRSDAPQERILLCDDEEPVRRVTASILRSSGYEVFEVSKGAEAIELIDLMGDDFVDVLVTDIQMPGMNGIELAKTVRRSHNRPRIVLISGYSAQLDDPELDQLVDCTFVPKPFRAETLLAAVRARQIV